MHFGVALGIVIDLGGILGEGSGISDDISTGDGGGGGGDVLASIADSVGGILDERRMIQVPFRNIPKAIRAMRILPLLLPELALAAEKAAGKAWYKRVAFYIGPNLDIGFLFVTVGACLGGFGCLAGGGGIRFGSFGIGALFPFWKWWE
ncbi:MAG: hypothetical protein JWN37_862 [Candidatus Nomurabacteria bacterium]|nr:hypothetical protein [Candidatus Nomurabacteria bacterium]